MPRKKKKANDETTAQQLKRMLGDYNAAKVEFDLCPDKVTKTMMEMARQNYYRMATRAEYEEKSGAIMKALKETKDDKEKVELLDAHAELDSLHDRIMETMEKDMATTKEVFRMLVH